MKTHTSKLGIAALFLALTFAIPTGKHLAAHASELADERVSAHPVSVAVPSASIYQMYSAYNYHRNRALTAAAVDGIIAVGGVTGLLCGVQLAVGVTFAA